MGAGRLRKSNMELLRIISMLAVILVHLDGAALGLPAPMSHLSSVTASDVWKIVVESVTIIGVNCFTLISGYFGIRASAKGLIRFTLICIFYSVGIYSAIAIMKPETFSWTGWIESWMIYTHTDLWYVPAYLLLYIISPMLNAATDTLPLRRFGVWLGGFVAVNVWCGWLWQGGFNPTGYTPVQLIMIYLIGRYIAAWLSSTSAPPRLISRYSLVAYLISVTATAVAALSITPLAAFAYNSPWVIASSVALFLLFTSLNFHSRAVNTLARSAFAAYLIHKNPAVWGGVMRPLAVTVWSEGSLWLYTGFCVGFSLAIYGLSAVADSFRRFLFGKCEALLDYKVKVQTGE